MAEDVAKQELYSEELGALTKAPYETLLKEFQETRQQLAEARVHIDKLRFGANFTIDHCFELLFRHQLASPQSADYGRLAGSTCSLPKPAWTNSGLEGSLDALPSSSKNPAVTVEMEDACTSPLQGRYGNALVHIRELQDQVNTVAGTIHDSNASLEELCGQLTVLQLEHQKVTKDIGTLLESDANGKGKLLQRELAGFAEQLTELNILLRQKTQEMSVDNDQIQHLPVMGSSHEISEAALPQCYFIESGSRGGCRTSSSSLASQSLESSSHSETSSSPLPSSPSFSPPPPSLRLADEDRISQVQRRLSMQTRSFILSTPQPVLSSSSSSSMSSSLAADRSRERPKRKKRLNLPHHYKQESEAHTDPFLLDCSDSWNISSNHNSRKNNRSKIPLPLRVSPKRPSHSPYANERRDQTPLWQDDSGFGGSPYSHLNHWQATSSCGTSVHSLATVLSEEQDERERTISDTMPEAMERKVYEATRQQLSNSASDRSSFQQQHQLPHDAPLLHTVIATFPYSGTSQVDDTNFLPYHGPLTSTPLTNPLHVSPLSHHPFSHTTPSTHSQTNCTAISPKQYLPDTHSILTPPTNNFPTAIMQNSSTNTPISANTTVSHNQPHTPSLPRHATDPLTHISATQQAPHAVQLVGPQPFPSSNGYSSSDPVTSQANQSTPLLSNDHRHFTSTAHGHRSSRIPLISRNVQLRIPSPPQYNSQVSSQDEYLTSAVNSELHLSTAHFDDHYTDPVLLPPQSSLLTSKTPAAIAGHHRPSRIPLPKHSRQQFSRSPSPSRPINTSHISPSKQRKDRSAHPQSAASSTPLEDRCTTYPPSMQADEHVSFYHTNTEELPVISSQENFATPLQLSHNPSSHEHSAEVLPAHSHHRPSQIPIHKHTPMSTHHLSTNQQDCYFSQSTIKPPSNASLDGRYSPLFEINADVLSPRTRAQSFSNASAKDELTPQSPQPIHPPSQGKQHSGANLGDRPAQIPSLSSRLTHVLPSTHISTTQHQKEPRFQYAPSPEQHHLNTQSAPPLDSHGQHNISSSSIRSPHQSSFKTLQSSSSSVQKHQQPAQIHSSLPHTMQTHCPVPAASPIQYPPTTPLESRYDQNLQANHSQMNKETSLSRGNRMPLQTSRPLHHTHSTAGDNHQSSHNHLSTPRSVIGSCVPPECLSVFQQENGLPHNHPAVNSIPFHDQAEPSPVNTQFSTLHPRTMHQTNHQSPLNPATSAHQNHHYAQIHPQNLPSYNPQLANNPYHQMSTHQTSYPQTHSSPSSYTDTQPQFLNSQNSKFPLTATEHPYNHCSPSLPAPPSQHVHTSPTISPNNCSSSLHFTPKPSTRDNTYLKHLSNSRSLPSRVQHYLTPNYSSPKLTKTTPPPIHLAKETQTVPSSYHHHPPHYSTHQPSTLPYTMLHNSSPPPPQLKTQSGYKADNPQKSHQKRTKKHHWQFIGSIEGGSTSERESNYTNDSSIYVTSQRFKRATDKHLTESEKGVYSDCYTDSATDSSVTVTPHKAKMATDMQHQHLTENDVYRGHYKLPSYRKRAVKTVTQPILLHIHPKVLLKETQRPVRATNYKVVYDSGSEAEYVVNSEPNQIVVNPSHKHVHYVPTRLQTTDPSLGYYTSQTREAGTRRIQRAEERKQRNRDIPVQIDENETVSLTEAQELAEKLKQRSERMNRTLIHNLALL